MRLIDADAFEQDLKEKLLPLLMEKYGKEEAMKGLHFSLHDCISNIQGQPTITQPEIIRCKDCKYRDENWRRVSVKWLPCMDARTGSNWYCGSAERGEMDAGNKNNGNEQNTGKL